MRGLAVGKFELFVLLEWNTHSLQSCALTSYDVMIVPLATTTTRVPVPGDVGDGGGDGEGEGEDAQTQLAQMVLHDHRIVR